MIWTCIYLLSRLRRKMAVICTNVDKHCQTESSFQNASFFIGEGSQNIRTYMSLVKCSPSFGGHHGLSLEFWRTLQKWAKLCFFLLARVHGTIIIQKNQVHQALFTLGYFFNVNLPSDYEKHYRS